MDMLRHGPEVEVVSPEPLRARTSQDSLGEPG
jgi:hypothetical protein